MRIANMWFTVLLGFLLLGPVAAQTLPRLLKDLTPGTGDSFVLSYSTQMDAVYISGSYFFQKDCGIYKSDGTTAGTQLLIDESGSPTCQLFNLQRLNDVITYRVASFSLWSTSTSGTPTRLPPTSDVTELRSLRAWKRFPGWAFFDLKRLSTSAYETWLTDGTVANTRLIKQTGTNVGVVEMANGTVVLLGDGLWTLVSPTATATPIVPTSPFQYAKNAYSVFGDQLPSNRLYFMAYTAAAGLEPWSTDFTAAGTTLLVDHTPGSGSSSIQFGFVPGGEDALYFVSGDQLYRSALGSGTSSQINPAGTVVVTSGRKTVELDGDVSLIAMLENSGRRIWKLRASAPAGFAAVPTLPLFAENQALFEWVGQWPERSVFGNDFGAINNSFSAVVAPPPADVTIATLAVPRTQPDGSRFAADEFYVWADPVRRWRRGASAPELIQTLPVGSSSGTTRFGMVGGSSMMMVQSTPTTGREPYLLDLLPNDMPMCNRANKSIPDNGGMRDILVVRPEGLNAGDVVLDLRVKIELRHSWVGDLRVELQHTTNNKSVVLMDRPQFPQTTNGCSRDDVNVLFDDAASLTVDSCLPGSPSLQAYDKWVSLAPEQPLSAFVGDNPTGNWQVVITDSQAQDIGGLVEWCLDMDVGPLPANLFANGFE